MHIYMQYSTYHTCMYNCIQILVKSFIDTLIEESIGYILCNLHLTSKVKARLKNQ